IEQPPPKGQVTGSNPVGVTSFRTWIACHIGLVLCVVGFPAVTGLELSLKINISGSKRRRT
ncbi:MAG: hypothetical protein ACO2Z2_09865, partial [Paracoccaceae bacterium]